MGNKKSKWSKYKDRILQVLESTQCNASPRRVAIQINEEEELNLNKAQIDLLRTYVRRQQQSLRKKMGMPINRTFDELREHSNAKHEVQRTWDEKGDSAVYEYKGEKPIRSLKEALHFSDVDLDTWEVDRHIFNSWDVAMKNANGTGAFKRTNYQVKVWFRRKQKVEIDSPVFRNIKVEKRKAKQMWIIIGCIHRPFHDKILWDKLIAFLKENSKDITGIIINGDYLDLRSLSSHEEWIPEGIDLSVEYSDGLQGIEDIESCLNKNIDKIFIYGNHEDRFFRDKKSIRKYGSSLPAPHEALELEERGWEVITDWKNGYVTLGKNLDVFHGVKVGINAAKDQLASIPNRSHIFNHTHRFGTHSNKTNTAYNIGCMIDFNHDVFKYVDRGVRESWAQGFAIVYIDKKDNNYVYPIKVDEDGGFFFKGDIY